MRPDGVLEFLGRIDHQVKIRGHRIELGEIEENLTRHPAVSQAVVDTHRTNIGDRLVAYIVPIAGQKMPAPAELINELRKGLPGYMLPESFVELAALPLTAHGKINRRALPAPTTLTPSQPVEPRTSTEKFLAQTWADLLKVDSVGVTDNFFELGGHSLLATQVVWRLRK